MARSPDYDDKTDEARVQPRLNHDGTVTPVLEPNEARQGEARGHMRYVLGFSLAGIVVVFTIAYVAFFGSNPADPLLTPGRTTAHSAAAPSPAPAPGR